MKIKNLISFLETIAPPVYQESYDNAGLIVGHPDTLITGVLICLDSTEAVIEEAKSLGCNLVIAHHPIVFKGLKRFNGNHYVERVVIEAIKNDIAIYAIHTNLDNVYAQGVNAKIAAKLQLKHTKILAPKKGLKKLIVNVPHGFAEVVRNALFQAGAGTFNGFDQLSVESQIRNPKESKQEEVRIETIFPMDMQSRIIQALFQHHPTKNPAYEILSIENDNEHIGSGMIGELEHPMDEMTFLKNLKQTMQAGVVKYTALRDQKISKVAVCGGAGGFLLSHAIRQQADIFITADYKYHEFFDADGKIIIADIGHYESEQYTIELLHGIISQKFSIFAAYCTKVNTNPVKYL